MTDPGTRVIIHSLKAEHQAMGDTVEGILILGNSAYEPGRVGVS